MTIEAIDSAMTGADNSITKCEEKANDIFNPFDMASQEGLKPPNPEPNGRVTSTQLRADCKSASLG